MAVVEEKVDALWLVDIQTIGQAIGKLWRRVYPPLPDVITERNKMLVIDFLSRLFFFWPLHLLSVFGSRIQLVWHRLHFNFLFLLQDKKFGEDEYMKVTSADYAGIPVRVYEPKKRKGDAAIIFIHGGGFAFCSVATYDFLTRYISRRAGLVLVSIDYRLAPEHKYPAAVQDCERAAVYFLTTAYQNYSVDPQKVIIMGDSAGGNLTAVTVQRLRSLDVPQPKLQVMIYPWTQMVDLNTPSCQMMAQYRGTSMSSPELTARFTLHYLVGADIGHYMPDVLQNRHTTPELRQSPSFRHIHHDNLPQSFSFTGRPFYSAARSEPTSTNMELYNLMQPYLLDPNVSPLLHPNLEGSPKTMILTVEIDPLRDDGILYAERLRKAGVHVVHKHYQDGFHGMVTPGLALGRQAVKDIIMFINENL